MSNNTTLNSCQICTKKAVGYHYGAYVCEACKKFFVRHTSGICQLYGSCQENGQCDLTINGRGKCQHCRFKRCTDVGMSITHKSSDYNLTTIPCQVCGAKSSGLHFGCITCEGCKGFFRRMIKFNGMLLCYNNNKCELNSNTRSGCKSCRLGRCINIGMSRKGIRIGRHPNSLKHDCINLLKLEQHTNNSKGRFRDPSPDNAKSQISSIENEDSVLSSTETNSDQRVARDFIEDNINQYIDSDQEQISDIKIDFKSDSMLSNEHGNVGIEPLISTDTYCNRMPTMLDHDLFEELERHIIQIINNMSPTSVFLTQKELNNGKKDTRTLMGSDSSQNVWSAMMDHFVFHSQFIVKFAKLIPGFLKLALSDKKIVIKDAMYPMILMELSQEYSEINGEIRFNYFDFSSSDSEIILEFFPEFVDFSNHLKRCGSIMHLMELNGVEMTLLCGIIMFCNYQNLSNILFGQSMSILYQEFLIVYYQSKLHLSSHDADNRRKMCLEFIGILNDMNICHHKIITDFCGSHSELQYPDLYIEIFNN